MSLVPSLTELLVALGLAPFLVGRTGFCVHPKALLQDIPKIGGTKAVDEQALLALAPTHLVVNKDENEWPLVERLSKSIPHIMVTHPLTALDNLALFDQFGNEFAALPGVAQAHAMLNTQFSLELQKNRKLKAALTPQSVLYMIWKDPWMSIASNTYIADMLDTVGWINHCKISESLAETGASRYPVLSEEQVLSSDADYIFLSSEPYRFRDKHVKALSARASAKSVLSVDGEMCSWYGPRAIMGLRYLRELRLAQH